MLRLAYCFRSTDTPTLRRLSTARTSPVVLRPYQESCVNACLNALNAGSVRIGVSLPTGSGKTTVFIHLLSKITPPADKPNARRSLVIVNSVELARQTAVQAHKMFLDWTVEIEQGVKYHASGQADMSVTSLFFMFLLSLYAFRGHVIGNWTVSVALLPPIRPCYGLAD